MQLKSGVLANKIKNEFKDFNLILSPAMGGILVGYELGKMLNKTIFSERVNGDFKLRRDFRIKENDSFNCRRCNHHW